MPNRAPPPLMNQEATAIRRNRQGGERKAADEILALVFDNETGAEVGAGDVVIIDSSNERAVVFAAAKGDPAPVVVYMGGLDEASIRCVSSGVIVRIICDGDAITPGDLIVASATNKYGSKITAASLEGVLGTAVSSKAGAVTAEVQVLLSPSGFGYLSSVPTVINNWTRDSVNGYLYPAALTDKVGIGVVDPDAWLEILGITTQLKLSYDADSFVTLTLDASDDLTVIPAASGGVRFQPTVDTTDFFQVLDADGGTPVFNVDTVNERVGIGTATPAQILDLVAVGNGNINVLAGGHASIILEKGNTTSQSFLSLKRGGSTRWILGTPDSDDFGDGDDQFIIGSASTTPEFYLDKAAGVAVFLNQIDRVGIRTVPDTTLHILESSAEVRIETDDATDPVLSFKTTNTAHQIDISLDENAAIDVLNIANTLYVEDTNNRVGVNIAAPLTDLHLYEDNADIVPAVRIEQDGAGDASMNYLLTGGQSWSHGIDNNVSDAFVIAAGADLATNPWVTVLPNGNVGLGISPAAKLHLSQAANLRLRIENTTAANPANTASIDLAASTTVQRRTAALLDASFTNTVDAARTSRLNISTWSAAVRIDTLTLDAGNVGVNILAPLTNFHIYENTADTEPTVRIEQDGAGDSAIRYLLTGGQSFSTGIDNSIAGDPFVLAAGAALQTNPWFMLTPAGVTWIGDVDGTDYVEIGATGDLVFVGGAGLVFGGAYGDHIAWVQAAMVQNTWYNISDADMASMALNGVTHDGSGELTVTEPGMYLVSYAITYQVDHANEHIEVGIELNGSGSATAIGHLHAETKFANQEEALSGTVILDLADNTTVEVTVQTTDAGNPDILIDMLLLTVTQIGGT